MQRKGLFRPRHVELTDTRSPMLRLLTDGQLKEYTPGKTMVAVWYDAQWKTLWKAIRLGYLDEHQVLTEAGKKFINDKTI